MSVVEGCLQAYGRRLFRQPPQPQDPRCFMVSTVFNIRFIVRQFQTSTCERTPTHISPGVYGADARLVTESLFFERPGMNAELVVAKNLSVAHVGRGGEQLAADCFTAIRKSR